MIIRTTSMADAVLALVEERLHTLDVHEENVNCMYFLEPYKNGRERGWCLLTTKEGHTKMVCFAEHRSSDAIVVYSGKSVEFSCGGNVPSDEVWKKAKTFSSLAKYTMAVKHVVKEIRNV